ncbi:heavy metal-binding domain-containing protein [Salmonirosea aquatica]|uniref:Heavy metal binding domain-containing protein n=1 Tax=Salmonirosea aquatica TaxID=2654236 RepID=A0A7C9BK01_9BACT|nr:hypothetical protein [Cytophagaceae bacterium SJW1-29]
MKKVFFALVFGTLAACSGHKESTTEATGKTAVEQVAGSKQYACPMKCEGEKTYAEAGKCPVCSMGLKEIALANADSTQHDH